MQYEHSTKNIRIILNESHLRKGCSNKSLLLMLNDSFLNAICSMAVASNLEFIIYIKCEKLTRLIFLGFRQLHIAKTRRQTRAFACAFAFALHFLCLQNEIKLQFFPTQQAEVNNVTKPADTKTYPQEKESEFK